MNTIAQPSPLELQVLSVLWTNGESTVREVLEKLPDGKDRAYTTALSVLQTMERKELVTRKTASKAHVYKAKKTEKQILVPKIKDEIANVFGGSGLKFISCALDAVTLTEDEKAELTELLKAQKTKGSPKAKQAASTTTTKKAAKKKTAKKKA